MTYSLLISFHHVYFLPFLFSIPPAKPSFHFKIAGIQPPKKKEEKTNEEEKEK